MADKIFRDARDLDIRWKDMGDGTYAQVMAVSGASGGGGSAPSLPAGTNRSGSIATGGTAQELAPENTLRKSLTGQNIANASQLSPGQDISTLDLWINEVGGMAAAGAEGSYCVQAGQAFQISTNRAISVFGATTGQKFTATES